VVDRFRPEPGKNLDCRNELLLSVFIELSFLSPLLLIRKKFFNFCGKGLWPLVCLFDDIGRAEKLRFSLDSEFGEDPLNKVVIEDSTAALTKAAPRLRESDVWRVGLMECRRVLRRSSSKLRTVLSRLLISPMLSVMVNDQPWSGVSQDSGAVGTVSYLLGPIIYMGMSEHDGNAD
jgi:hypothetical protein